MCPFCLEGTHPDQCQCSSTYEPECVPANPTRECFEKTFLYFRFFFLEKDSDAHEKEDPGNIMKICIWFSECPSLGCNLDCNMGQVVDFAGCPVCKCIDPEPHYCKVGGTVLVHADWPILLGNNHICLMYIYKKYPQV